MKNVAFFYAAYGLVWGAVAFYSLWLGTRLRTLERRLEKPSVE